MFEELNERELQIIKEVSDITITDYELKGNFIPVDSYMSMVEDLLVEYNRLLEENEDLKETIRTNNIHVEYI